MGRCILKLPHATRPYLEWSSIVDAPVTRGMSADELRDHIKAEYGNEGLRDLPRRLERADRTGTSAHEGGGVEGAILCNRAGAGETWITLEQIVDYYCERQCVGEAPVGAREPVESSTESKPLRPREG